MIKRVWKSMPAKLACNLVVALAMLMISRIVFVLWNFSKYADSLSWDIAWGMFRGGLTFDLSALFYVNALFILLYIFPLHWKECKIYHSIVKWIFVALNSIALAANLCDAVYIGYTGRRTTSTIFTEFANENNLGGIVFTELLHSWILVVVFALMVWGLIALYRKPQTPAVRPLWKYYLANSLTLIVIGGLSVAAIRGGFTQTTRPITISNANAYVDTPIQAAAVLNTPFSIIRTIGKTSYDIPPYMSMEEAEAIFSPVHQAPDSITELRKKNVVIFILESFSRSFIGELNKDIPDYEGYTEFTDSIIPLSLTFTNSFANGMKSIDAMPSILSGIPMMIEPFFLTPASMNKVGSIASLLKPEGYRSAFFHGAPNGSMGFEAYARAAGFDRYYGMNEYVADKKHGGMKDFDGNWAIWDAPFFNYFAEQLDTLTQPFVASIFSATSHHPFQIPKEMLSRFPEEGNHPMFKCIRYTDDALRQFFNHAAKQSWFDNTLFVILSDHSSDKSPITKFKTALGMYNSPIIFYAPGDSTLRGYDTEKLAQQIDVLPTILSYLGYSKPYVAFGIDLLTTPSDDTFLFSYLTGMYQYTRGNYFMQFDGNDVKGIYRFREDPELLNNLIGKVPADTVADMERRLKSFIQQYADRMRTDRLTVE